MKSWSKIPWDLRLEKLVYQTLFKAFQNFTAHVMPGMFKAISIALATIVEIFGVE